MGTSLYSKFSRNLEYIRRLFLPTGENPGNVEILDNVVKLTYPAWGFKRVIENWQYLDLTGSAGSRFAEPTSTKLNEKDANREQWLVVSGWVKHSEAAAKVFYFDVCPRSVVSNCAVYKIPSTNPTGTDNDYGVLGRSFIVPVGWKPVWVMGGTSNPSNQWNTRLLYIPLFEGENVPGFTW